jgi:hypothetical protein
MAPGLFKSLVLSPRKQREEKERQLAEKETLRLEARREQLKSRKHRKELLDINYAPFNRLPLIRDLEYPLAALAMVGSHLQQTFEQGQLAFVSFQGSYAAKFMTISLRIEQSIYMAASFRGIGKARE